MTLRPPSRGFSVSRRLSERARAAAKVDPTGADPAQADPVQAGSFGAIDFDIPGLGGLAGMAGTLRSLLEQVAAAARSHNSQGDGRSTPQDPAPDLHAPDQQAPDQHTRTVTPGGGNARMVFGYTLRMGPDGIAAEPFGHVPPTYVPSAHVPPTHVPSAHVPSANASASTAAPVALQPIVEVFEDGAAVIVVAELPGADPATIVCRPDGNRLLIEASGMRRYRKDLSLPAPVRAEGLQQSYRNGILEVRLVRADAS